MKKTLLSFLIVLLCFSFADAQIISIAKKKAGGCEDLAYARKAGAAGTSVQLSSVASGSLVVVWMQWQDAAGDATVSDGSSTFACSTTVNNGNQELGRFCWTLSSVASGTVTYTGSYPGGAGGRTIAAMEFTKSSGTFYLDTSGDGATGASGAATSQSSNTTGSAEIICGGGGWYADATYSSATIGGDAVDDYQVCNDSGYGSSGHMTYRLVTSTISGCASAISTGAHQHGWVADMVSFKCE